jgi:hypothetical protein
MSKYSSYGNKKKIYEQRLNILPRHVSSHHFMTILSVSIPPTSQILMWNMMLLLVDETKNYNAVTATNGIEITASFVKIT